MTDAIYYQDFGMGAFAQVASYMHSGPHEASFNIPNTINPQMLELTPSSGGSESLYTGFEDQPRNSVFGDQQSFQQPAAGQDLGSNDAGIFVESVPQLLSQAVDWRSHPAPEPAYVPVTVDTGAPDCDNISLSGLPTNSTSSLEGDLRPVAVVPPGGPWNEPLTREDKAAAKVDGKWFCRFPVQNEQGEWVQCGVFKNCLYGSANAFVDHYDAQHRGIRWRCTYPDCNNLYTDRANCNKHMKRHGGCIKSERTPCYRCSFEGCGKEFPGRQDNRRRHEKTCPENPRNKKKAERVLPGGREHLENIGENPGWGSR